MSFAASSAQLSRKLPCQPCRLYSPNSHLLLREDNVHLPAPKDSLVGTVDCRSARLRRTRHTRLAVDALHPAPTLPLASLPAPGRPTFSPPCALLPLDPILPVYIAQGLIPGLLDGTINYFIGAAYLCVRVQAPFAQRVTCQLTTYLSFPTQLATCTVQANRLFGSSRSPSPATWE